MSKKETSYKLDLANEKYDAHTIQKEKRLKNERESK